MKKRVARITVTTAVIMILTFMKMGSLVSANNGEKMVTRVTTIGEKIISTAGQRDLQAFSEITPETYSNMERASEKVIRKYLNRYTYYYDIYGNICVYDEIIEDRWLYEPAMILYKDKPTMVFTTESGKLMYLQFPLNEEINADIEDEATLAYKTAHCIIKENEILIYSDNYGAFKYKKESGKIEYRTNNEEVNILCTSVPENSEYCGYSGKLGYLFRNGTDVYVYAMDSRLHGIREGVIPIAHNVKTILCSNYSYDEENKNNTGVPMFLMEDNSIKIYMPDLEYLEKNQNAKMDLEKYLVPIISEGGYADAYNH